jgi:hypothetical protein
MKIIYYILLLVFIAGCTEQVAQKEFDEELFFSLLEQSRTQEEVEQKRQQRQLLWQNWIADLEAGTKTLTNAEMLELDRIMFPEFQRQQTSSAWSHSDYLELRKLHELEELNQQLQNIEWQQQGGRIYYDLDTSNLDWQLQQQQMQLNNIEWQQ